MCKFESSQKNESKAQSADYSKAAMSNPLPSRRFCADRLRFSL